MSELVECGECGDLVPVEATAEHVCFPPAPGPWAGERELYLRHPFSESYRGSNLCAFVELDDDGAEFRCGRPYGEHLPAEQGAAPVTSQVTGASAPQLPGKKECTDGR